MGYWTRCILYCSYLFFVIWTLIYYFTVGLVTTWFRCDYAFMLCCRYIWPKKMVVPDFTPNASFCELTFFCSNKNNNNINNNMRRHCVNYH